MLNKSLKHDLLHKSQGESYNSDIFIMITFIRKKLPTKILEINNILS